MASLAGIYIYTAVSLLSVALVGIIVLYALLSVFSLSVFYIKESLLRAAGRPHVAGTVFHQLVYFDTLFDYQTRVARRHRTFQLIKTAHSEIFTADPANVEHILKTNFSKYSKGKYNYSVMNDLLGDGIFTVNGDKWLHQRKLASHEFSTKVLRSFSSVAFRKNAAKLAKKISAAATGSTVIDLQDLLMKSALDSIFKVGFGLELDTLSGSDEFGVSFSKAFDESNAIIFRRYVDIFWSVKRYLNIGLERQLKKNINIIDDFVYQLIQRKRESMKHGQQVRSKEDILSRFMLASNEDPDGRINDKYLRDIILNFLIAGKDTTANTLSWFFYMLCKHPTIQEKILLEIRESVEKVVNSEKENYNFDEFTARLTEESIDKMQYLHAAITETLRLYPAVPVDGKCADEDDVLPDGLKVKKGDGVNYMMYAMGRMTYLWGEDAEEFKPDRWLANGAFQPASPFKFVAFNAGPRICLGKEFAYRQMKILAATLIHFFRFKPEDETRSLKYRTMFTLHVDGGLPVTALSRIKCE